METRAKKLPPKAPIGGGPAVVVIVALALVATVVGMVAALDATNRHVILEKR